MVWFEIKGSKYVMFETHQHYFRNLNNLSVKVGVRANWDVCYINGKWIEGLEMDLSKCCVH